MKAPQTDISRAFSIEVEKIKVTKDENDDFYWFYVRLHLQSRPSSTISLSDVAFVDYHLRDDSFPVPDVRISDPSGGFEYKFWLYGFIEVDADVVLKSGELGMLNRTKLRWPVTDEEIRLNGRRELTW